MKVIEALRRGSSRLWIRVELVVFDRRADLCRIASARMAEWRSVIRQYLRICGLRPLLTDPDEPSAKNKRGPSLRQGLSTIGTVPGCPPRPLLAKTTAPSPRA